MTEARHAAVTPDATAPDEVLRTEALLLRRPDAQLELRAPPLLLRAGEAVAWLGPSGAGKTTLLGALLGVLRPPQVELQGARWFATKPLPVAPSAAWQQWLRNDVALVPQDARAALDPMLRLGPQMVELSGAERAACGRALQALGEAEADDVLGRYPHQVSGGQAQRVLLAAALARSPRLLVADEPTASLDRARQGLLLAALQALRARGGAVLVATHDADFARALAARAFTVGAGAVRAGWPPPPQWPPRPQPQASPELLLRARGLGVKRGGRWVLRGVDLDLAAGEVIAILGPSGAGKTTLAAALAGLLPATAGRVERVAGSRPQLLFQDAYASLTPGRTLRALARETAAAASDIDALARALGLDGGTLSRPARELSGGQRRRAALLRALTVQPRVLLLDEPTASLDSASATAVLDTVLAAAAARQAACLVVTHDAGLASALAHRTLTLEDGALIAS